MREKKIELFNILVVVVRFADIQVVVMRFSIFITLIQRKKVRRSIVIYIGLGKSKWLNWIIAFFYVQIATENFMQVQ